MYICYYWSKLWLVAWLVQSHYINQCWIIVNWTFWDTLLRKIGQSTTVFIQEKLKCKCRLQYWPFSLDLYVLKSWQPYQLIQEVNRCSSVCIAWSSKPGPTVMRMSSGSKQWDRGYKPDPLIMYSWLLWCDCPVAANNKIEDTDATH